MDLAAWSPESYGRLQRGYAATGAAWADAAVWPTIDHSWVSIRRLRVWPDGKFKIFTPARAASAAEATVLLPSLGALRLTAIHNLAKAAYISIEPTAKDLAVWAQAIAARLSTKPEAAEKLANRGPRLREGSEDRRRVVIRQFA